MIKLSYGSMVMLGLKNGRLKFSQETIYAILGESCDGKCLYCGQRTKGNRLGLVNWYELEEDIFLERIREIRNFYRICFEVLHYKNFVADLSEISRKIKMLRNDVLVSATVTYLSESELTELKNAGLDSIGIGLDASTEEIFRKVKIGEDFAWEKFWNTITTSRKYFDEVSVHVIAGLGESDEDLYRIFDSIVESGCKIALFNLTDNNKNILLEPARYHSIQIMRYLIENYYDDSHFEFKNGKLEKIYISSEALDDVTRGLPFMTSGCRYCTRPGYTDIPQKHIYNFPYVPSKEELDVVYREVRKYAELVRKN